MSHAKEMLRRNYVPVVDGASGQAEGLGKLGVTPRLLNGEVPGLAGAGIRKGLGLEHPHTVENFSPLSSTKWRYLLYMQPDENPSSFSQMKDALTKQQVGDRLRLVREAQNKGLREFARLHGIDHTSLSQWEKGKSLPSQAYLRILWEHYHIGPNYFYLGIPAGLPYELVDYLRKAEAASEEAPQDSVRPKAGKSSST